MVTAPAVADSNAGVIDFDRLREAIVHHDPFDYFLVHDLLAPGIGAAARAVFPDTGHGGLVPAETHRGADVLGRLLDALRDPELTAIFSERFGIPLDSTALMIHLRSRCRASDGGIHVDSESKVVTALLYLNESWTAEGGKLRLLRRANDMEDMAAEVEPVEGTLIAFRRSDFSYHGHKPFEGVRRYVMLNWMVDARAARREQFRHGLSARIKRFTGARR